MMIGGAVVNGLAFTGGNYLFSQMKDNADVDEQKRHNAAVEELTNEKQEYEIKREKNLAWKNELIRRQQKAEGDLSDVSYAFDEYTRQFPEPYPNLKEPVLDYHSSEYPKNSELVFFGLGTAAVCYGAYKFL